MPIEKSIYEICLKGHLDESWISWFEGFRFTHSSSQGGVPVTKLSGVIADQSALHGILFKLRDIGIPILSINRVSEEGNR